MLFKSVKDFRKDHTMQVEGSTEFFTRYVVPEDGNCFFYAYWLATKKDLEQFLSKNSPEMHEEAKPAVEKLRREIVKNIRDNITPETKMIISTDMRDILYDRLKSELYAKYAKSRENKLTPPQTELEKIKTETDAMTQDELYEKYLNEAKTTLWADERMILTLETIKRCRIDVYMQKDTSIIGKMKRPVNDQQPNQVVSVLYALNRDHYDALLFDNDAKQKQEGQEQAGREQRGEQMRRAHGAVDSMFVRPSDMKQKELQAKRELEEKTAKERDKQANDRLPNSVAHVGHRKELRDALKVAGRDAAHAQRGGQEASSRSINRAVKGAHKDRRRRELSSKDNNEGSTQIIDEVQEPQSEEKISEEEIQYRDEQLEELKTFYENLRFVYEKSIGTINDEFLKILADFLLSNDKDQKFSTFADIITNYERCKKIIINAIGSLSSAWLAEEIKIIYGKKSQNYKYVKDILEFLRSKEYLDKDGNKILFSDVLQTNLYLDVRKWLKEQIDSVQGDLENKLHEREEENRSRRRNDMLEKKEQHTNQIKARKENKYTIIKGPRNWWKPCRDWWRDLALYHPKFNNNISQKNLNEVGENLFNRLERVLAGQDDSCERCLPNHSYDFNLYNDEKATDVINHRRNDSIVYDAFLQCFIKIWKASLQNLSTEMANKVRNIGFDTDSVFDQGFWHDVVWSGWDSWHLCKGLFIQVLLMLANTGLVQYSADPLEPHDMTHRIYFQVYTPVRRDAYDHNRANPADLTRLAIWYDGRLVSKGWCHKIRDLFGINQRRFMSAWVDALREYLVIRDNAEWKNKNFFDGVFQWRDVENYVEDANLTPDQLKIKRNRWKNESGKVVKTKNDYCFILPAECLREFTQQKPTPEIIDDFCREFGYQRYEHQELTEEQKENKKTFNRACQQFTLRMNVAFQELVKTYERHMVNWANPDKRLPGEINGDPLWRMRPNKDDLADEFIRREYMKKFGITEQKDRLGHTETVTVQASTFATPYLVCLE